MQPTGSGGWLTKAAVAAYIDELGKRLSPSAWMAIKYSGKPLFKAFVDFSHVRVVPMRRSAYSGLLDWWNLVWLTRSKPYVLFFLPAAMRFAPILSIVKIRSCCLAVYLAGDYELWLRAQASNKWHGWSRLVRFGYEASLKEADVVIARGRRLAELARRHNGHVVETLPIAFFNDVKENDDSHLNNKRVLYVGKLTWSKGIGYLLRAFKQLMDSDAKWDVTLDVVGDGENWRAVLKMAEDLELKNNVKFYGWVDEQPFLDSFYRRATVLVVPSTSKQPEGVPRVIDEALFRGVRVVATRVGGIPDEFGEDVIQLVQPDSVDELEGAIRACLNAPKPQNIQKCLCLRRQRWGSYLTAAEQHAAVLCDHQAT